MWHSTRKIACYILYIHSIQQQNISVLIDQRIYGFTALPLLWTLKLVLLQAETDDLYKKISEYEDATKEANGISDKFDADIRDSSKRVTKLETNMEETMEKLQSSVSKMEEAEKEFKDKDDDVNAAFPKCFVEDSVANGTEC